MVGKEIIDKRPISFRIDATEGLTPQVGILMERQLGIDLAGVKINLALIGETVAHTVISLHMTHFSCFRVILFSSFQDAPVLAVIGMNIDTHLLELFNQCASCLTVFWRQFAGSRRLLTHCVYFFCPVWSRLFLFLDYLVILRHHLIADIVVFWGEKADVIRS